MSKNPTDGVGPWYCLPVYFFGSNILEGVQKIAFCYAKYIYCRFFQYPHHSIMSGSFLVVSIVPETSFGSGAIPENSVSPQFEVGGVSIKYYLN